MKLQANSYYLNAMGEIRKIVRTSKTRSSHYPYYDEDRSYSSDGKYSTIYSRFDLLLEIPKDKYKAFIEELINDQRKTINTKLF